MIGELSIISEWIPEQMEPGTVFVLENAGEVGEKRRSLLGGAILPVVRHAGLDYAQANGGTAADNLRFFNMLGTVFYQG